MDQLTLALDQLDNTQTRIESTSALLIQHQIYAKDIVKLWFKAFRLAQPKKKIALLHLANHVIQSSGRHQQAGSPLNFNRLFEPVLPHAFKECARTAKQSIRNALAHLLVVWASRQVYPRKFLRQLRHLCQRAVVESANLPSSSSDEQKRLLIASSPFSFSFTAVLSDSRQPSGHQRLTAASGHHSTLTGHQSADLAAAESTIDAVTFREELSRQLLTEATKPPTTDELLDLLNNLASATASDDAETRRLIAQFAPETSDPVRAVDLIRKATTESEKVDFVGRIETCADQLEAYNQRLLVEDELRSQLELKLAAFKTYVRERVHTLDEYVKIMVDRHRSLYANTVLRNGQNCLQLMRQRFSASLKANREQFVNTLRAIDTSTTSECDDDQRLHCALLADKRRMLSMLLTESESQSFDLDELLELQDLVVEEFKLGNPTGSSADQVPIDDQDVDTPYVLCPMCRCNRLQLKAAILQCSCGLRLDTQSDSLSLDNVSNSIETIQRQHAALNCTSAMPLKAWTVDDCSMQPSIGSTTGSLFLAMGCDVCGLLEIVV